MTLSLSLSARPSVHFFSFSVLEVSSSPKEIQWCFKKVLSLFEVSGCFKEASRMFQGSLNGVSRKFQECFKEASGKSQGCFKKVPVALK